MMKLLKLFGWAFIIHLLLIGTSILEVFIYSKWIKPGMHESFYRDHAKLSAPWIAIILGFILIYVIARKIAIKPTSYQRMTGIYLALIYTLIDVFLLLLSHVNWADHIAIFMISFSTKLLAGYLGSRAK